MDCEQFIEQICTDPSQLSAAQRSHVRECPSCAAYAQRAHAAETLIRAALLIDPSRRSAAPRRVSAWGSLAAAVVAGFAVWFGLAAERPAPAGELRDAVLAHWDHEPDALRAGAGAISPGSLEEVLAGEATIDLVALEQAAIGPVTYANKCIVAGQWMSHLVVQSGDGPVQILLIPQQSVESIVPLVLAERRLDGGIFPSGAGAVAVFGEGDAANAAVARSIAATIDISI